jgi:acyl transferase domain-containing protein
VLALHGPCVSYDTACSAALAASHAGLRALQLAECKAGLVAGVTLMLTPAIGTSFAVAGMTSARGRSHTFDARADGYARGEACGGVALDSDDEQLRMLGSAVRQDGRSASLTAPNGQAQQGLLAAALQDAGVAADSLMLNEAHGTGTALGDPIEAGSLVATVLRAREAPLGLGGVKTNIGHAEQAAGMTGLLKLALGSWCEHSSRALRMRGAGAEPPSDPSGLTMPIDSYEHLLSVVLDIASNVLDGKRVAPAAPLMDAGIDSLEAGRLVHSLCVRTGL